MHSQTQLSKSKEKINHLKYRDDFKLFVKKRKRIGNPKTDNEILESGHGNVIWHRNIRQASNKKRKTTRDKGMEQTNQEKSDQLQKWKCTNIWEYWMLTPSNKRR